MEIDAADACRILSQLEAAGLVVWLDGGWGVDALLGRQTRPHQDLDLVIAREDLAAARQTLAPAGFAHDATAVPGLPARLVLVDADGRQVDLHPVIFDRHGYGWQDLGADAWGAYPAEELTATGVIAGRSVRCKTPTLEVRHRLGYPLRRCFVPFGCLMGCGAEIGFSAGGRPMSAAWRWPWWSSPRTTCWGNEREAHAARLGRRAGRGHRGLVSRA